MIYADAVIEGGGVKAIGLVGAIYEAERRGYVWRRVAGTSAGALIASLIAAGYTAEELKKEVMSINYKKFIEKKGLQHIPFTGDLVNLWFHYGMYSGDYIEQWVRRKLLEKGVVTFADLKKTLYIIASDITSGEMLILPDGIKKYGMKPDQLEVAAAVRMSSSIPFFFKPVKIQKNKNEIHYIVDGGILSNFPVWIFDEDKSTKWPTFGFKLVSKNTGKPHNIHNPFSMSYALINTMIDAHDTRHIEEHDYVRTIMVPTLGVKATDFDINKNKSEELFVSGVNASEKFFDKWSFHKYIAYYHHKKKFI